MRSSFQSLAAVLGSCVLLIGCATQRDGYINKPIAGAPTNGTYAEIEAFAVRVERAAFAAPIEDQSPGNFVGVAISGGGSRAATFSAAALEHLSELGLLRNLKAISSVSGGSIAAAYYALHAHEFKGPEDWARFKSAMSTDFRGPLVRKVLRPDNLVKSLVSDYDRSEALAEVLDETLFKGATFGDLGAWMPGRPRLLINTTEITADFSSVPFVQEKFILLGSDLASYPIASAVAASASFPGLLNSVTLRDFRSTGAKTFRHFMDGGPSDNLAVDTLLDAAKRDFEAALKQRHGERDSSRKPEVRTAIEADPSVPFNCFIIIIDAYTEVNQWRLTKLSDLRENWFDRLVVDTTTINYAFDSLLTARRKTTLDKSGVGGLLHLGSDPVKLFSGDLDLSFYLGPGVKSFAASPTCQYWRIGLTDLAGVAHEKQNLESPHPGYQWAHLPEAGRTIGEALIVDGGLGPMSTRKAKGRDGRFFDVPVVGKRYFGQPKPETDRFMDDLGALAAQVRTDLRLRGPLDCSPEQLAEALDKIAQINVLDSFERELFCVEAEAAGVLEGDACFVGRPPTPMPKSWRIINESGSPLACRAKL